MDPQILREALGWLVLVALAIIGFAILVGETPRERPLRDYDDD